MRFMVHVSNMMGNSEERRLPVEFPPYPKIKETPFYELVYFHEVIGITTFSWVVVSYDSMFWGFSSRICAHFDILAKNIKNMNNLYTDFYYEEEANSFYGNQDDKHYNQKFCEVNNKERWRCAETIRIIKENIVHHRAILK